MKICVASDSHDRAPLLLAAAQAAIAEGAQALLHCGDVIGTNTLRPLLALGIPVHVVHGNNVGDPVSLAQLANASGGLLRYYGGEAQIEIAGRRIYLTHYPHHARAFAATGEFDLVCCGHSHEAEITRCINLRGGTTLLVNPGTVAGLGAPASYAVGDLTTLEFAICPLGLPPSNYSTSLTI
jgi:hypothetical protein